MKRLQVIAGFFFALGIIFLIISGLQGDLSVGIFLVFPFVIGSGFFAVVGLCCIIIAFLFLFLGFSPRKSVSKTTDSPQEKERQQPTVKGGGVVLLGPIPIIIGSSWRITLALILAAIVLMLLVFLLFSFS